MRWTIVGYLEWQEGDLGVMWEGRGGGGEDQGGWSEGHGGRKERVVDAFFGLKLCEQVGWVERGWWREFRARGARNEDVKNQNCNKSPLSSSRRAQFLFPLPSAAPRSGKTSPFGIPLAFVSPSPAVVVVPSSGVGVSESWGAEGSS